MTMTKVMAVELAVDGIRVNADRARASRHADGAGDAFFLGPRGMDFGRVPLASLCGPSARIADARGLPVERSRELYHRADSWRSMAVSPLARCCGPSIDVTAKPGAVPPQHPSDDRIRFHLPRDIPVFVPVPHAPENHASMSPMRRPPSGRRPRTNSTRWAFRRRSGRSPGRAGRHSPAMSSIIPRSCATVASSTSRPARASSRSQRQGPEPPTSRRRISMLSRRPPSFERRRQRRAVGALNGMLSDKPRRGTWCSPAISSMRQIWPNDVSPGLPTSRRPAPPS